jgi:CubicO group peptidase (beta-lactamase class C family)
MKIGQTLLDDGSWDGAEVVPGHWVTESTRRHLSTQDATPYGQGYGYLWWVGEGGGRDFYMASGFGGQFILVDPDLDLVVVSQADWRGKGWDAAGEQWYAIIRLIVEGLLPAVR